MFRFGRVRHGEYVELIFVASLLALDENVDDLFIFGEEHASVRSERVERAAFDERFDLALVEIGRAHPLYEVDERRERAVCLALRRQIFEQGNADVLDAEKPEADRALAVVRDDAVFFAAFVDVGRQDVDFVFLRLGDIYRRFRHVAEHGREQRRDEFARIMRFEICRAV